MCDASVRAIPVEEASFSTENYGFCYSIGDRRIPDYYNTLKAKDKKDNFYLVIKCTPLLDWAGLCRRWKRWSRSN